MLRVETVESSKSHSKCEIVVSNHSMVCRREAKRSEGNLVVVPRGHLFWGGGEEPPADAIVEEPRGCGVEGLSGGCEDLNLRAHHCNGFARFFEAFYF
jgi:hypothetical protein